MANGNSNGPNLKEIQIKYRSWCHSRVERVLVDIDTLAAEREHMERSFSERFNFFLVWVGLVVAGAFANGVTKQITAALLTFGALVSIPLAYVLFRTRRKFVWTLTLLREAFPNHAANANKMTFGEKRPISLLTINVLIGLVVPVLCVIGLVVGAVALHYGWITGNS